MTVFDFLKWILTQGFWPWLGFFLLLSVVAGIIATICRAVVAAVTGIVLRGNDDD